MEIFLFKIKGYPVIIIPMYYSLIQLLHVNCSLASLLIQTNKNYLINSTFAGNVDGTFSMDPITGILTLSRPVNRRKIPEYWLTIKAGDDGSPPKQSLVNVNIHVTPPTNAAPR